MNDRRGTVRRRAAVSSRNYELALERGSATAAKRASNEEVARRFREGMDRSLAEKDGLRRMLLGLGVDVVFVPRYLSFGVKLARICRDYRGATRENLARGLVREWEMRLSFSRVTPNPPDREVLLGICETGFGIKLDRAKSDVRSEMSEVRSEDGRMNRQGRQERQGQESEKADVRGEM